MSKTNYPLMKNNIHRSDLNKVISHLKTNDPILTSGNKVELFEKLWSKWLGVKYSVFLNSGSSANFISLQILKQKYPNGGEVIVSPLNWISDIVSIIECGFKPKFVDINLSNLAADSKLIINNISSKTVAILLSHIQGFNGLTHDLNNIIQKKKIVLIEDVCESHGASFNDKRCGTFGLISNFSFYYAHHLSTIEGGMICTNDKNVYLNVKMFRAHGLLRESKDKTYINTFKKKYKNLNPDFIFMLSGFNMRNNEIGAIIGINQLKRLDKMIDKRNKNHLHFLHKIDKTKFKVDFHLKGASNYAFNLILINKDYKLLNNLKSNLKKNNIEFRQGSAGGGNQLRQPYLKKIFHSSYHKKFPNTEHIHEFGFYIGNYPSLTFKEINFICKIINSS